ncbi:ATP-binding protein [Brevibacillus ginsengisoli]|uniref:ATP-binding protein n=1 Tax=Brevibacillus ginsengisoli TaxID=363854 RepID=UPI003CEA39BD
MKPCERCPSDPNCTNCLDQLGTGSTAKKVIPPRSVNLIHLNTRKSVQAELCAVSRLSIGIIMDEPLAQGRYEVELAADFRIIVSTAGGLCDATFHVLDIEKVLRKDTYSARLKLEEFQSWHLSSELEPGSVMPNDTTSEQQLLMKQELEKLTIIHQMQEMYMLMYEAGKLRHLNEFVLGEVEEVELRRLIQLVLTSGKPLREQLYAPSTKQIYDVHILPLGTEVCGIGMINLTGVIAKEHERKRQEWDSYKVLLQLFTNGKLELIQDFELYGLLLNSEKLYAQSITTVYDLKRIRDELCKILEPCGLSRTQILRYTVAVNEAASNCLSHCKGGQIDYYLAKETGICRIVICDHGQGIVLYELPKAALIQGYSTRDSLGRGFHAMLTFADKVLINSSSEGTKIVLEIQT